MVRGWTRGATQLVVAVVISRWRTKEMRWSLFSEGTKVKACEGGGGERERRAWTPEMQIARESLAGILQLELGPRRNCGDRGGSAMRPSSMPSCPTTTCFDFIISPHRGTMSLRSVCSPFVGSSFASWCLRRGAGRGAAAFKAPHLHSYRHLRLLPFVAAQSDSHNIEATLQKPESRSAEVSTTRERKEAMALSTNVVWLPIFEEAVFRFDQSEDARKGAAPCFSFTNSRVREEGIDVSSFKKKTPTFVPQFSTEKGQQVVTFQLPTGTSFYGTGEVGGGLERTGKRIFTWNTDAWGYNQNTVSLYQSHPWVFNVLPTGEAFGVLADTALRTEIDLRKETIIKFAAAGPYPVITFGPYATPSELVAVLARATGTIQMPPKWALGYQQCRWSYETAERVWKVASTFREKKMPCDVIWMDIDYMDGFRCFTFDQNAFPDVKGLINNLHDIGFKGVWMVDPGLKVEEGYEAYDTGSAEDVWIQNADGKTYVGECWPGPTVFPDFTNKKTCDWWSKRVKTFVENGVDGIWNDMNEPAVFKTVTKTMPETNIHRGDEEFGGTQNHGYYHNVYGNFQAKATMDGMLLANPEKRPFVLSRAGFIGNQRYAATWTGDNLSNWEHLAMSVPMALNLGLSGQPLSGPDIGGFAGDATPKMFVRWMGIGAMMPFSRAHSEKGTIDQEPWAFGPEAEDLCRQALNRRYRLLPHFYTLFYKAHLTGLPVITPLFFADPTDPKLRKIDDSFLLGSILVGTCPLPKNRRADMETVLPPGIWQRFHFGDDHPELPLLYLKGGGIVPTGPVVQSVEEAKATDTVTLLVALDENGRAEGVMYEDDNDGFGYQDGNYLMTYYEAEQLPTGNGSQAGGEVIVRVARCEGNRQRPKRTLRVRLLLGHSTQIEGEGLDGDEVKLVVPGVAEINEIVESNHKREINERELTQSLIDEIFGEHEAIKGAGAVTQPVELDHGDVNLQVCPWIGGRIFSLIHKPSGQEWLEGRLESGRYEEYSTAEFRSPGCTEAYTVLKREVAELDGQESVSMEGDIGGGLIMARDIVIPKESKGIVKITSSMVARSVGAGSGGFSRLVCLRIRPMFKLAHALDTLIKFTAIDGTKHEIKANMDFEETVFKGSDRPNGEWMLQDMETGLGVINRFNIDEVETCVIEWGSSLVTLELWTQERGVSKETPLVIAHQYELIDHPVHHD